MRKQLIIGIAALVAPALLSCTKDDVLGEKRTVKATIEEEYLDGSNAMCWGSGATFSLFPGTLDNVKYDINSGSKSRRGSFKAETYGLSGQSIETNVAVSPYCSSANVSIEGGVARIETMVPETQTFTTAGYYDAGVCPMVAVTGSKKTDDIGFVCPVGGISLKLTGETSITKVVVTANGGEIINGKLTVVADKDGVQSAEMTGGSSTITLECPEGIQLTKVAKDFVVFLPYGVYSDGFTISAYSSDGDINIVTADGERKVVKARILNVSRAQFVKYEDLNESSAERANCYMVTEAGGYFFDATVKGNGQAGLHPTFKDQSTTLSPAGAKLLWEEVPGLVTGVAYEDGKIYFACSGKDGNALIGATDSAGEVIWSWHVWSTSRPADLPLGDWTFMDRNLGASSDSDHGLYYQWGRKDPFSSILAFDSGKGEGNYHPVKGGPKDSENVKNTIEYSVAHPDTYIAASSRNNDWLLEAPQRYLWGVNFEADGLVANAPLKTIYDPCPAGYSVATPSSLAAGLSGATNEGSYITLYGGALKIPAGGFLYSGGFGWYNQDSFTGLWSCSTSWGNTDNAFRLKSVDDAYDNYDRATGSPVRCIRFK